MNTSFSQTELKDFLNEKVELYNRPDFIQSDPIRIPKQFTRKEDIEISAFLISTLAWGNRTAIIKSGQRLLEIMNFRPYEYVMDYEEQRHSFVHRTFNHDDLNAFFVSLQRIYRQGGLEAAFAPHTEIPGIQGRIISFRNTFTQEPFPDRTQKHLANPLKGSSAKRINMFLRWMVRKDESGVDFGIWNSIPMSELHLPLDVHTGNVARKLGILTRTQNDWKSVTEIQEQLVQLDPEDPCKYDFALFGLGVFEGVK
ncbi:TIGR02757 family protein [Fluviicola chungangensis]|uniref:TIGR02757 family protein n=1 Tax=Fluviicola chungangensis TaxID=2597671 RepID=A0A556N693_9FLAO|nr:TIGR02757 family protein [Fluviicola chungangensis]TSJ47704.1 TIGR02757 family protein [Fluviicola chungangensis]